MSDVEVWLDVDFLAERVRVGTLSHDRGALRFAYDAAWLKHELRFAVDPELTLDAGAFHPRPEQGNFRIFDDSAPDRWGQTLMRRREALTAKDENRRPRTLYAWDFLLGVQDLTRQGALRFRSPGGQTFLADDDRPAPPVTSLGQLEAVAFEVTNKRIDDLDALRQWLAVLVAPGASLGGARPKANFTAADGSLWIAKFPSRDDERDIGAWEGLTHDLAQRAGIHVPTSRLLKFHQHFHTFCTQRFDRLGGRRRFYSSAMALLRKDQSEGTSYLELAEFIHQQGARGHVAEDLHQLFKRVVFNVAVGNRDDHLRNHGFILTPTGWRLSPAFDVNPNTDKTEHVLNLDEIDNRPSLEGVIATAEYYQLSQKRAAALCSEILQSTRQWRQVALERGISRADIEITASAFDQTDAPLFPEDLGPSR
jgi:serine/threonine-protein kinase HipA